MTSPIAPPSPIGLLRFLRQAALGTASAILFGASLGALISAAFWILYGWMLCKVALALGFTVPAELDDSLGWARFGALPGAIFGGIVGAFHALVRTLSERERRGAQRIKMPIGSMRRESQVVQR